MKSMWLRFGIGLGSGLLAGGLFVLCSDGASDSSGPKGSVSGGFQSDPVVEVWDRLQGGFWLKPNVVNARVVQPDRPHSRAEVEATHRGEGAIERTRSYSLTTSSQRLRHDEVGPKKPGVIRLVAIGDSVTHGWGVSRSEAYPAQLESYLKGQGKSVEVINAGVPANALRTMATWCEKEASTMDVDWVLWTRRIDPRAHEPARQYAETLRACQRATGARILAILPPISTFDVRGSQDYLSEFASLQKQLADVPVLELTDVFRAAQQGLGEVLVVKDEQHLVVDQESGETVLVAPVPPAIRRGDRKPPPPLDPSVYALFEDRPDVREALFFDEGHPDAEGFVLFAQTVGDWLMGHLE